MNDNEAPSLESIAGIGPKAKVLLLGTFHFAYPNLDTFKAEEKIDILSPQWQAQVADLAERLAAFRPTKIAVETHIDKEALLNERYLAYRNGTAPLTANETDQLGFRLGAMLGHDRLYAIDDWGRQYDPTANVLDVARRITASPDDRLLVIYGAGHLSLLRHALQSSPKHELVPVEVYLD